MRNRIKLKIKSKLSELKDMNEPSFIELIEDRKKVKLIKENYQKYLISKGKIIRLPSSYARSTS